MQPVKNQEYEVEISGYNSDGAGVARIDGQVVFIPSVIRGETCKIKILKVNKNIAYGKLILVVKPSPYRVESECEVYPKCGGCDFWHMSYEEELRFKEEQVQNVISRIGGIDLKVSPIVGAEEIFHYRNKAQFPVGKAEGCVCGFYRSHSHDIVPCSDCKIQSHFANAIAQTVLSWMDDYGVEPYNEESGKGTLRHIYVRNTMLCLVVTKKPEKCQELILRVTEKHPETSGILLNYNKENTNVILGKKIETLWGECDVTDTLCGNEFAIAPHAFYQVNHAQAETLYRIAIEKAELSGDETVLDLYCGAGTITLALSRSAKKVIGVEIIPQAVENAKNNAKRNSIENAEFICGDATKAAATLQMRGIKPDVVVVDPPRKGLTPDLVKTISEIAPKRVVYVSCDSATLARDIKLFGEQGYKTENVTPVDMFPRTRHCECVACLSRKTIHEMKLCESPFEKIKSGAKNIELRLYDEKRQKIKPGDDIIFTGIVSGEKMRATVKKLHLFDSFEELYKTLPLLQCGYTAEDIGTAHPSDMQRYYSEEEQQKYGVVGIEIFRVEQITDE